MCHAGEAGQAPGDRVSRSRDDAHPLAVAYDRRRHNAGGLYDLAAAIRRAAQLNHIGSPARAPQANVAYACGRPMGSAAG